MEQAVPCCCLSPCCLQRSVCRALGLPSLNLCWGRVKHGGRGGIGFHMTGFKGFWGFSVVGCNCKAWACSSGAEAVRPCSVQLGPTNIHA